MRLGDQKHLIKVELREVEHRRASDSPSLIPRRAVTS